MSYMPLIEGRVKHKKLFEMYVKNVLKELKLNRLRTRPIQIRFMSKIECGALGLCEGNKEYAVIYIAKTCPVTKRKFTFMEIMKTLTHELVHARQFLRGELKAEGSWTWKGRPADGYAYKNQPWEKEAYRLEDEIFAKCFPIHVPFSN